MTTIKIKLNRDEFRALISGQPVRLDQQDIVRSERIHLESSIDDSVEIILEDIGWPVMTTIIEEVSSGDASTQAIKARDLKILNDDSVWNLNDQSPERKP